MKDKVNGYCFSNEIRSAERISVPFAFVVLGALSLFCWVQVFRHISDWRPYCIIALISTIGVICIFFAQKQTRGIAFMGYTCSSTMVTNSLLTETKSICFNEPIFITEISREFSLGKSIQLSKYILFSYVPFSGKNVPRSAGLFTFKTLWSKGIVVLPLNDQTAVWLSTNLHLEKIPEFPNSGYIQKHKNSLYY